MHRENPQLPFQGNQARRLTVTQLPRLFLGASGRLFFFLPQTQPFLVFYWWGR